MKYLPGTIISFMLVIMVSKASGQNDQLYGLWEIEKVTVGEEIMTPVAKWTRINEDGSFQSGNGWLQNSQGTWEYDEENQTFLPYDPLAMKDEYGAFTVSFEGATMRWDRKEDGMDVKVYLSQIEALPMAPADYLKGMWDLVEITENGTSFLSTYDPDNKSRLMIRWDRLYREFTPDGKRESGYWHIHSHRPEVTLLPHQEGKTPETWRVNVDRKTLILTGISESNQGLVRVYSRG